MCSLSFQGRINLEENKRKLISNEQQEVVGPEEVQQDIIESLTVGTMAIKGEITEYRSHSRGEIQLLLVDDAFHVKENIKK